MTKTIAALVLAVALVPANAANISFDIPGRGALHTALSVEAPVFKVPAPAVDPMERFSYEKIVGGVQATPGEFPFIVSLKSSYGGHFCGGSLIAKNWVLTAAHCVEGGYLKSIAIGLHNQSDTANVEKFNVVQIVKHPDWNSQTMNADFALVKLAGDSKFPPIALNNRELSGSVNFVTAGWGTTSEGGGVSRILMKVGVPLVSPETCAAAYPDSINGTMICAGYPEGGKDSCQGDSGGPLVVGTGSNMKLAGVVSWGEGCARPNKYGVYSKVSGVLGWIGQTIK